MASSDKTSDATTSPVREVATITRIKQEDFLAQLAQALALYDRDGDGLLSEEEWKWVEDTYKDVS